MLQPLAISLNHGLVAISVSISVIASYAAFSSAERAARTSGKIRVLWLASGGVSMGLGVWSMHCIEMLANGLPVKAAAVIANSGLVLLGTLVSAVVDRTFYDQLRKERDYLHAVAECSLDCLYLCEAMRNPDGEIEDFRFTYLNSNVEKATALPLRAMIGARMREVLPIVETYDHFELYKQVVASGEPLIAEFSILDKDEKTIWIRIQAVKLRDGLVITASDITARKRDEEHIRHLAHHDPLTGLVNRSLLHERINQAMERARRYGGIVGVFMIDVDTFKQINDTFGHSAGDGVLIAIANRLKSAVRTVDSVIRVGGDEFVVVMPDMREWRDLERSAEKFVSAFQPAIWLDGHSVSVTCSVGVAVYPASSGTALEILAEADAAMYRAKRKGKNQFKVWQTEEESELTATLQAV